MPTCSLSYRVPLESGIVVVTPSIVCVVCAACLTALSDACACAHILDESDAFSHWNWIVDLLSAELPIRYVGVVQSCWSWLYCSLLRAPNRAPSPPPLHLSIRCTHFHHCLIVHLDFSCSIVVLFLLPHLTSISWHDTPFLILVAEPVRLIIAPCISCSGRCKASY